MAAGFGSLTSSRALPDQPLARERSELLDLAYRAASALPVEPHGKTRSRLQETVCLAALRLHQPELARTYARGIANWRRGACAADLAFYYAQHGTRDDILLHLEQAQQIADATEREGDVQAWRRDRIRAKIARTHLLLGHDEQAARAAAGVVDSESGQVEVIRALTVARDKVDAYFGEIDAMLAGPALDQVRAGLEACAQLVQRFYADADLRDRAQERVRTAYPKLPPALRAELLLHVVGSALDHEDRSKAAQLLAEASALIARAAWLPDDHIRWLARLAAVRHRLGDIGQARRERQVALEMFEASRARILDIDRADVLRAVAEATAATGDHADARALYRRALAAGVENPNSRPRAEDLTATCLSLALHDVTPDAELMARLRAVLGGLRDPW
jgi:hypothetical protein